MNSTFKKVLSYLFALGLGLGLLYFVFNQIDLKQTWDDFKNAKFFLVFLGGIFALLSHIVRAVRWNLMLKPMGYNPGIYRSSLAVLIGYITNLALPRAGEVARSVALQNSSAVPFDKSFGAVIAERLIDVLVLLVLVVLNLILEYDRISVFFYELFPSFKLGFLLPGLLIAFVLFVFLFFKFKERILRVPLFNKIWEFVLGLKEGFLSVLKLERPGMFIIQSFMIWTLYYIVSLLLCYSVDLGIGLSPLAVLTILVMGSIGMAVPTVGGLGSYHLLVGKILLLYGLSNQEGISLATFLHTFNGIIYVLIFGLIAMGLTALDRKLRIRNY